MAQEYRVFHVFDRQVSWLFTRLAYVMNNYSTLNFL